MEGIVKVVAEAVHKVDCGCAANRHTEDAVAYYRQVAEGAVEALAGRLLTADAKADVLLSDGTHRYWSTHCRHGDHDACDARTLAPGVPRRPAQCKTCAAPCRCRCHGEEASGDT